MEFIITYGPWIAWFLPPILIPLLLLTLYKLERKHNVPRTHNFVHHPSPYSDRIRRELDRFDSRRREWLNHPDSDSELPGE